MAKQQPLQRRGQFCYLKEGSGHWLKKVWFSTSDASEAVLLQTFDEPGARVAWFQGPVQKLEEFKTIAFAMRRMANILEGKVTFEEFATQPSQKPSVVKV